MEGGGVEELCWGREQGGGAVRWRYYRGVYNIRSSSAFALQSKFLRVHLLTNSLLDIITTISCSPFTSDATYLQEPISCLLSRPTLLKEVQ